MNRRELRASLDALKAELASMQPPENFVIEVDHESEHLLPPRRPGDPPQIVIVLGPEHVEPPVDDPPF